uniref:Retrovirus-related Pol polyprotein from transposon TNT 1-94-like beta-barrel domain-containing protein n=1 Tax=Lactuca sativa TaxID=4236 RepID=A0A9R1W4N9_LACSA|nr:hypothetical protein LSAT_V11C300124160 [Lactuca sativa]
MRQQPSVNFVDYCSQVSSSWVTDTGSNNHVAVDLSSFDHSETYNGHDTLHVGNGKGLPILHISSSHLYSPHKTFHLSQMLHVPEIKQNLLSVQKFCDDNNDEITQTTLLTSPSSGGLYSFHLPQFQPTSFEVAFFATRDSSITWHQCLGHPHSCCCSQ